MTTALILGLGELGGWALEFLSRSPGVDRIVTATRSAEVGVGRAHLAAIGAVFQGYAKPYEHRLLDVFDVEATTRLLAEARPDVVLSTMTLQSPRLLMKTRVQSDSLATMRSAGFAAWLPWHLLPAARLTEAVAKAGIDVKIINTAFPDVVNAVLWKRFGHGPQLGAGNVEITAAAVARHVAETEGVGLGEVKVGIVGSHAFFVGGPAVPHYFHVEVDGRDITDRYDISHLVQNYPTRLDWRNTSIFSVFAASAVKNLLGVIADEASYVHVSGPMGLPGGYPALISRTGVEIALPPGIDLDQAVAINTSANKFDGIESIEDDGTVVYTDASHTALASLGYDHREISFDNLESCAHQLKELFHRITAP